MMTSMTVETLEYFRRTLRRALDTEMLVEKIRQEHSMREQQTLMAAGINTSPAGQWSKRKAFDQMDWLAKGFVQTNEVQMAIDQIADPHLRRDKNDTDALIRRFNKDRGHGKISLKEFIDELTPKVPTKSY